MSHRSETDTRFWSPSARPASGSGSALSRTWNCRTVYRGDPQRFEDSPEGVWRDDRGRAQVQPGSELTVHLTTRLRLKDHDPLVRRAPSFPVLMQRFLERAECLGLLSHRNATLDSETKRGLIDRGARDRLHEPRPLLGRLVALFQPPAHLDLVVPYLTRRIIRYYPGRGQRGPESESLI
jgi:hypothetical protein